MGSVVGRRLARLEAHSSAVDPCRWCEQSYWTMVADNPAIGLYSETEYGHEAGLVTRRAYNELLRENGYEVPDELHLDYLPVYDLTGQEHEGIIAAWNLVIESRPPRAGCECIGRWAAMRSVEARVLYHYPRVAERMIEALEHYAASPFEARALYHFAGDYEKCACVPAGFR